jgi:hypothetical protein
MHIRWKTIRGRDGRQIWLVWKFRHHPASGREIVVIRCVTDVCSIDFPESSIGCDGSKFVLFKEPLDPICEWRIAIIMSEEEAHPICFRVVLLWYCTFVQIDVRFIMTIVDIRGTWNVQEVNHIYGSKRTCKLAVFLI